MRKFRLDNGLVCILDPIESVVSASVGLWVKTGSRNETVSQYGYAHFVEHMLFKGTKDYSAKELAKMVDRVGGQHNAATNREYTCYYINLISDYLEMAAEILSQMFFFSNFDAEEIEKEKNVILEEIRMYEDAPDELIHDVFMDSMLKGHPLGHSILGTEDTIHNLTRESLLEFYNAHYGAENTILVIAGKFDIDATEDLVRRLFGRAQKSITPAILPAYTVVKDYRTHLDRDLEQVHFCLGWDGLDKQDPSRWALYILSTILGGSMSSRLFQNIREKEGLCYSIYSFHSSYTDSGVVGIYCGMFAENYRKVRDLVMNECSLFLKNGITGNELDDAKTFMKGNFALSLESTEVRMGHLARNEIIFGRSFTFEELAHQIDSVNMEDFNALTQRVFGQKRAALVTVGRLESVDQDEIITA